jgi:hypothetical protein
MEHGPKQKAGKTDNTNLILQKRTGEYGHYPPCKAYFSLSSI